MRGRAVSQRTQSVDERFRERDLWNIRLGSLWLHACELHDFAPLFDFSSYELGEVGGRGRKHRAAQVSKSRLHLRIGKGRVDFLVELVDDLGGRVSGRAHAEPRIRLVSRYEFA